MTFSNKISKLIYTYTKYYNSNLVKEIQKEADNYAVDFAEWTCARNAKKLLEIYKKERNL